MNKLFPKSVEGATPSAHAVAKSIDQAHRHSTGRARVKFATLIIKQCVNV